MSRLSVDRWLQAVQRRFRGAPRKRPSAARLRPARFVPRLESLEDRTLPSTFLVTNLHDSGAGSLRLAVQNADATSGAVIDFAAGLHGTITLKESSGQLNVTSNMTINGPGASVITVSGNNASRVFDIGNNATATISGLTIANGSDTADEVTNFGGGGILNEAGATLTLNRDVLKNNTATASNNTVDVFGGGLLNEGNATVVSCTFSGNQALGGGGGSFFAASVGGGIDNFGGATLTVTDSTFTGNQALGAPSPYCSSGRRARGSAWIRPR